MQNLIKSVLILIAVIMSARGEEEIVYAQVGETVTLSPPGGNNSPKYLYWFFGNEDGLQLAWLNPLGGRGFIDAKDEKAKHWNSRLSLSEDSLIIKDIQQQHFGTFICKMTSNRDGDTAIYRYKVVKLSVNMNPPSPLLPGESLSLDCNTESPKKSEILWLNPQGKKMTNNQGQLTVTATDQHSGQWTCVVKNGEKENKATLSVVVIALSSAPSYTQYTSKSSALTIPCIIPTHISWEQLKDKGIREVHWDFFPIPGSSLISDPQRVFSLTPKDPLVWEKKQDKGLTPSPQLKKGILSLTRNKGREEDRGDYVCTLKFTNGVTLNRTVRVHVLQITSSPGTDLISGQQVNLTCSFGHPLPSDLKLKWIPPKQSSLPSLGSDHHPAHLTISGVGTGDSGQWSCQLLQRNKLLTTAMITLKIEPRLSVWMLVIICSAIVIAILLLVLVIILCRRRQRKMRHLRHRLCQCKNPNPKGFYRT